MAEKFEKYNMNNVYLENTFSVKEELKDSGYIDDRVVVCETSINCKVHNNIVDDNVKIEEDVNAVCDIKIEFGHGLLLCDHCHEYYQDYCTRCGMLVHILNNNAPKDKNRQLDEVPKDILEIRQSFGECGVFALKVIPENIRFGPFIGFTTTPECPWKLKGGKLVVKEDKSKFFNWMQYINPAKSILQQNLLPFQYENKLYYHSNREIQEGEELLVYFGEVYEDMELNVIPTAKDVKDVFACSFCCLGFSSRAYLAKHKRRCLNDINTKYSIEELIQCPSCKIYLGKEEYFEYHMACCYEQNDMYDKFL